MPGYRMLRGRAVTAPDDSYRYARWARFSPGERGMAWFCEDCGALVYEGLIEKHEDFHERIDSIERTLGYTVPLPNPDKEREAHEDRDSG